MRERDRRSQRGLERANNASVPHNSPETLCALGVKDNYTRHANNTIDEGGARVDESKAVAGGNKTSADEGGLRVKRQWNERDKEEKYRYDDGKICFGDGDGIRTEARLSFDNFPPNPNMRILSMYTSIQYQDELHGMKFEQPCFFKENFARRFVASKTCIGSENQIINVFFNPMGDAWQPNEEIKQKIINQVNDEFGYPLGFNFTYLDKRFNKSENGIPPNSIILDISFFAQSTSPGATVGRAIVSLLDKDSWVKFYIKTGIPSKYSEEYCKKNAEKGKHSGDWVIEEMDFEGDRFMDTMYHELMHALIAAGHTQENVLMSVRTKTTTGVETNCRHFKKVQVDRTYTRDGNTATDTIIYPRLQDTKTMPRGVLTTDAVVLGSVLGHNKEYFKAERQLGQSFFTATFNISDSAPIVATKCRPKDGHGTTISPSRAFVVIDSRDCAVGRPEFECGNCTSVLGEKPFDYNMMAREQSMLRTPQDKSKGVQMFTATPQAALFASCDFVVKNVQRPNATSKPIIIHTSMHVNAPEEGVEKKYGNYPSVMSYVISEYDNVTKPDCVGQTYAGYPDVKTSNPSFDWERIKHLSEERRERYRAAQALLAYKSFKIAAERIHESVGGQLCEQFSIDNIKDPATFNIAINLIDRRSEALDKCMPVKDANGLLASNVVSELKRIVAEKQAEIDATTTEAITTARATTQPTTITTDVELTTMAATTGATTNGVTTNGAATNGVTTNGAATNGVTTNGATTKKAKANAATNATTASPEETATAQTIYDEITKSVDVKVDTNWKGQFAGLVAGAIGVTVAGALAAGLVYKMQQRISRESGNEVERGEDDAFDEIELQEFKPRMTRGKGEPEESAELYEESELDPLSSSKSGSFVVGAGACAGGAGAGLAGGSGGAEAELIGDEAKHSRAFHKSSHGKYARRDREIARSKARDKKLDPMLSSFC